MQTDTPKPIVTPPVPAVPVTADDFRKRMEALGKGIEQLMKEKEEHRLDIENRFQQAQKALKDEWDQTRQNFDMRINALQQELLKAQGVYEYLHNSEQASKAEVPKPEPDAEADDADNGVAENSEE